jgi:hypothetical protein
MKLKALLSSLFIAVGGSLIVASEYNPAQAYAVTFNGRTGGTLNQQLRDITLHSGDIGTTLDPTTWFLGAGQSTNTQDISGQAILTVLDLTPDMLSLSFTVNNFVDSSYQAALMSLGFGVTADAGRVEFVQNGVVVDQASVQSGSQNFPGGFKNIDICLFSSNNCSGGNINNGLQAGQFDTFIINIYAAEAGGFLNADGTRSTVTISDFATKWQTQDGSYELAGVPEPITMVGSGMALGLGALMKRKVAKQKEKQKEKAIA